MWGVRFGTQVIVFLSCCLLLSCRGRPLPEPIDLVLPLAATGQPYSFAEQRGEPLIVYFFATWCVPCQAMETFVAEAAMEGREEGIAAVGVSLDREGARTVRPYVLASDFPFPVVLGGGGVAEGRSPFGRIPEIPLVLILDANGRPSAFFSGVAGADFILKRAREVQDRT